MEFKLFSHRIIIRVESAIGFFGWSLRRKRNFAQRADAIRLKKANQVSQLMNSFEPYANPFIGRIKEVRSLAQAEDVFPVDGSSFYPCKLFVEEMFANGGKGHIL